MREVKGRDNPILQSNIAGLTEALAALNVNVDRLANARTILTDEAIGRLGRSVSDTLANMRGCAPRVELEDSPAGNSMIGGEAMGCRMCASARMADFR